MKRSIVAVIVGLTLVSGCATQILQSYVGKSVQEPILDYGPPINVVELEDGRRAYQWQINSSGVMPISNPTTSTIYGSGGFATVNTQSTNYIPYSSECLYTLTATKSGNKYIVDGYREPRLNCL